MQGKLQKCKLVAVKREEILQSLVNSCRHTGRKRQRGKQRGRDRGRERLIGLYLNSTVGFSGLSPAAALISLVVQQHTLAILDHFILVDSEDSLPQVSLSVCSVGTKISLQSIEIHYSLKTIKDLGNQESEAN